MTDHYATLGVPKTASADEIKRAYRKLASQHHPDKGGDVKKFQEIEQAYRVLSDPAQRQQYDNPNPFGNFGPQGADGFAPFNFDTIFDIFGARFGQQHRPRYVRMTLWVSLADVAQGGARQVSVQTQTGINTIEVDIPRGIEDGDNVQYQGIAPGGQDLVIQYRVHPDKNFDRHGPNLMVNQSVDFWTLICGGDIIVRDVLSNQFSLTIPPRTEPGTMLRMKGRGLPQKNSTTTGDLLVRIQAVMPKHIPQEIIESIERNRP